MKMQTPLENRLDCFTTVLPGEEHNMYELVSNIVEYSGDIVFGLYNHSREELLPLYRRLGNCLLTLAHEFRYMSDACREYVKIGFSDESAPNLLKYLTGNMRKKGLDWFGDRKKFSQIKKMLKKNDSDKTGLLTLADDYFNECHLNSSLMLQKVERFYRLPAVIQEGFVFYDKMKRSLFWDKDCKKFLRRIIGEDYDKRLE